MRHISTVGRLKGKHGDLLRMQLSHVSNELENNDLPDEERAALNLRKRGLERSLDPEDDLVVAAAALTTNTWRFQRFLYEQYGGGRILWQQFGTEAFDAMYKFLPERNAAGDSTITDPKLRAEFYDYWTSKKMHGSFLTSDEERIRTTFLEPPWLSQAKQE